MAVPKKLIIASRQSALALWQAHHVQAPLSKLYPGCTVEILGMTTQGDRILDRSLSKVGGKGLFVKELEAAIAEGRADLAVHSAKDVPMTLPDGFRLAAILEREDARDCLVSTRFDRIDALGEGARVGTSSLRREAQLRERLPGLTVLPSRQRRHAALEARQGRIRRARSRRRRAHPAGPVRAHPFLHRARMEPAGARAGRARDRMPCGPQRCRRVAEAARARAHARLRGSRARDERSAVGQLPGAARCHAVVQQGELWLRGLVASTDGRSVVRAEERAPIASAKALGERVAQRLRAAARRILAALGG